MYMYYYYYTCTVQVCIGYNVSIIQSDYSKRSCDYTKQDSQLRIKIKLSCPLNSFPAAVTTGTIQPVSGTIQPVSLRPLVSVLYISIHASYIIINNLYYRHHLDVLYIYYQILLKTTLSIDCYQLLRILI